MIFMCGQGGEPLLSARWVNMRFGEPWDNFYLTEPDIYFQGSPKPNPGRYIKMLFDSNTLL